MSRNTRRDVGSSSIGTLLSGYSSFGGGMAPLNMGHPAVAKITLAPGILNLLIATSKSFILGHNPGKAGAPKPPKVPDKPVQPYMR